MSQRGFNLARLDDNLQLKIFVYAIMTMERTEHGYAITHINKNAVVKTPNKFCDRPG